MRFPRWWPWRTKEDAVITLLDRALVELRASAAKHRAALARANDVIEGDKHG